MTPSNSSGIRPPHVSALAPIFVRASSLHIGGAASVASLWIDLVEHGHISAADFNEAFAVARLTPGTNFLALYAALGYRLARWRGTVVTLASGTVVPSVIASFLAALYVRYSQDPVVAQGMRGARVGAVAVLLWAIIRLIQPPLQERRTAGLIFAGAVLIIALTSRIPAFLILLAGGATGAVVFRRDQ